MEKEGHFLQPFFLVPCWDTTLRNNPGIMQRKDTNAGKAQWEQAMLLEKENTQILQICLASSDQLLGLIPAD